MQYKANVALIVKGDRVRRGAIVELDETEAKAFKESLTPFQAKAAPVEEKVEEKPLSEMTHKELKAKAKKLGLSQSGSVADLLERIALAAAPVEEKVEEKEDISNQE